MVILRLASSNNFSCNTTFVSASSWEDIKDGVRVKLEFSIFDTSASKDKGLYRFSSLLSVRLHFIWKIVKLTLINVLCFHCFVEYVLENCWQLLTSELPFLSLLMLPGLLALRVLKKRFCKNLQLALLWR